MALRVEHRQVVGESATAATVLGEHRAQRQTQLAGLEPDITVDPATRPSASTGATGGDRRPVGSGPRAALAGFALRAPLAGVPENTMKFIVGVMLTSFGIFWGAEGAGAQRPGADTAQLALVPAVARSALALVAALRQGGRRVATAAGQP